MNNLKSEWIRVICVFLLTTINLHAVLQEKSTEASLPQYRFVQHIKLPVFRLNMITFVKKFTDGSLIIIDNGGECKLLDASYNHVGSCSGIDEWCIDNAYKYSQNNQEFIIASSNKRIWLLNPQCLYGTIQEINLPSKKTEFILCQRADLSLFMVVCINRKNENIILNLFPDWDTPNHGHFEFDTETTEYLADFELDTQTTEHQADTDLDIINLESFFNIDKGLVPSEVYQTIESVQLSNDIFDLSSVSDKDKAEICFKTGKSDPYLIKIVCYHKTSDNHIILGHASRGLVTIWKRIE